MDFKKKISIWSLIMVLVLGLGFSSIPQTNAQFVVASWDYPDEYGQGIDGIKFYENSTGSWVAAPYYTHYYPDYHEALGVFYYLNYYQDNYEINWSAGAAMKLRVYMVLNNTLTGASDAADGQNYQRHNVTVTSAGTTIFSQQNFTYYDVAGWVYEYEVVLNFIPADGQIYTVVLTYEIFFSEE